MNQLWKQINFAVLVRFFPLLCKIKSLECEFKQEGLWEFVVWDEVDDKSCEVGVLLELTVEL